MSEEIQKPGETEATPNRGRRRDAPVIEGEAIVEAAPEPTAPPPAAPAPARTTLAAALPGLAALLLSGAALYLALNPSTPQGASPDEVAALAQKLDRLESRVAAMEARPAPKGPDLAPIEGRVRALESRPIPQAQDLSGLNARIESAEKAAQASGAEAARALETARNAPKPPEPPRVDLTPIEQRIAKLETGLGEARQALAAPKTEVRATAAPDVPGVSPSDTAALAVVAESLRAQIDRGAPFPREAAALEKLGAEPARLAKLKPLAATGAPSAARLAQDFAAAAPAMLRAVNPPAANGDIMDRIARSASSLVRIRPVGDTAGDDAPALIGRIEAALRRDDVSGALASYDRLPAEAKEPAKDWAALARQRVDAEAAARSLIDEALDKLARK